MMVINSNSLNLVIPINKHTIFFFFSSWWFCLVYSSISVRITSPLQWQWNNPEDDGSIDGCPNITKHNKTAKTVLIVSLCGGWWWKYIYIYVRYNLDGLMQERRNSNALAMELCQSCTNPSIWLSYVIIFSCDQAALQMVFSVRLSVRLSHLFDYVPIIVSSWNFQELLPMTKVRSMQKVKVRGQRSRSQRSQPNLAVSRL